MRLLVGDPVEDPGEQRVLKHLIADLNAAGIDAVLYANFVTPGRVQRQVDLLIWTPERVLQVEIKELDQSLPVIGHVNGEWQQRMPDGTLRSLGKNFYRQALDATYGVSDRVATAEPGPSPRKPFKSIDTIVCIYPEVPPNSELDDFDFVTVLGYQDLLTRISKSGRPHPWTRQVWEVLARDLNVYDPTETDDGQADQRELDDYRRRAASSWAAGLAPLAELGLTLDGDAATAQELEQRLRGGEGVLLSAPSGFGKSFIARHFAVRLAALGEIVIWLRADEYERGRLRQLLAKAAAPFSSVRVMDLVGTAVSRGIGLVVVLDGVNECRPADQVELLEQLAAFRLRYRCGVLVTSTERHNLPDGLAAIPASLLEPDPGQRIAILEAHGALTAERVSAAFRTPHELELAARCESQLLPGSTVTDLHDAYIRMLAPAETVRAGLRAVASFLHSGHRSSAPLLDVTAHLAARSGDDLAADLIDEVFVSPLLDQSTGRVRFGHELLRNFLVAEHLVREAATTAELADRLREPANRALIEQVLELDRDTDRVVELLDILADQALYVRALSGDFGSTVRSKLHIAVGILLREAVDATSTGCAEFDGEFPFGGRWVMNRTWAESTSALLRAVGRVLPDEHLNDLIELFDRTDEFLRSAIDAAADGAPNVSQAVAATYAMPQARDRDCLPVSLIAAGAEHRSTMYKLDRAGISRRMLATPNPGWGRCWGAAATLDATVDGDLLPELVERALVLGGYHLILNVLWVVQRSAQSLTQTQVERTVAALEDYEPKNWALSSTLVEALAALGVIEAATTVDQIRGEIARVIARSDDPEAAAAAASIISNQFENEGVVGPYYEAVDTLDPLDRVRLILLGTDHPQSIHVGWKVRELARSSPTGDSDLDRRLLDKFLEFAKAPHVDGWAPHEDVEAFLYAIEGVAKMTDEMPSRHGTLSDDELAWRLVGNVLLRLHRDGADASAREWDELHAVVPGAVPDVLNRMQNAQLWVPDGECKVYERVVDTYPVQVRRALHWAIGHQGALSSMWTHGFDDLTVYAVNALGIVGNESTVAILSPLVGDARLGEAAVRAIRAINDRSVLR